MRRLLAAIATMALLAGVDVVAQHAPEPKAPAAKAPAAKAPDAKAPDAKAHEAKPAEAKVEETKAPEAKAPEMRRGASASPLQTAAAVEQILRKLSQDLAKSPARRQAAAPARPRLRLTWRLELTWPSAVTDPQAP